MNHRRKRAQASVWWLPLDAVIAGHPIGEDIVDARSFDHSAAAAGELKWIALPEKVGRNAGKDRDRIARLRTRRTAGRIDTAKIHIRVAARALQPLVEKDACIEVPTRVRATNRPVDHVKVRVLVCHCRGAKNSVRTAVEDLPETRILQADQVIERDVVKIKLEVRAMRVGGVDANRRDHRWRENGE